MRDLRRLISIKTALVKTKPEQSKSNNFHLALSNYIYKELKSKGIDVRKKNDLTIKVNLNNNNNNNHMENYSVLIDCLDGNIYSSKKDIKDKKIGKLVSFKGERASDAFNCMKKSIDKIIKKLDAYLLMNDIEFFDK